MDSELDNLASHFAACIGSPYGEGATYEADRPERAADEGLDKSTHFDEVSEALFIKDLKQAIKQLLAQQQAKLEQAVLAEADDKHNGFGAVVTVDVIKQVFKEMK